MTYPQQHGGYQQPGQYGGYPQPGPGQYGGYGRPPQKKNNTAVVVVVMVAVLVLAGLGITGFVAPGFFLGDDKESATGIDGFAGTLVEAANEQDKSALGDLKCADATDKVDEAITLIGQTSGAELGETKEIAKDEYVVVVNISYQGASAPFAATVVKDGNGLCWQDFAPGSGPAGGDSVPGPGSPGGPADGPADEPADGPDGGSADAEAFVEEFLDAVNAKDAAKAEGMYCSDTPSNPLVDYVIGKNPNLTLGKVDRPGSSFVSYELDGTLDGEPLNLGKVSVRVSGRGSPCVFTFNAG
jgi:hypothetical protein